MPPGTDADHFRRWYHNTFLPLVHKRTPAPRPVPDLPSTQSAKAQITTIPGLCIVIIDKIKRFGICCARHWRTLATKLTDDPTMFATTTLTDQDVVTDITSELILIHGGLPPYQIFHDQPELASTMKLSKGKARPVIDCHQKGAVIAAQTLWAILCLIIDAIKILDPSNYTGLDSIYDIIKELDVNDDIIDCDGEGYFTGPYHPVLIRNAHNAFRMTARAQNATHVSVRYTARRPKARWCTANFNAHDVHHLDEIAVLKLITLVITKMYVRVGSTLKRQLTGGPMGPPSSGELCAINLYMCRRHELDSLRTDYPECKIFTSTDDELVANLDFATYQARLGPAMQRAGINMIPQAMTPTGLPYLHLAFYKTPDNRLRHRPSSKRITMYPGTPELATGHTRRAQSDLTHTHYTQYILAYRASSTHHDFTTRITQIAGNIAHKLYYRPEIYIHLYDRLMRHLDQDNKFNVRDRAHTKRRFIFAIRKAHRSAH